MEHVEKVQKAAETATGHAGGRLDVVSRQIAELTLDPNHPREPRLFLIRRRPMAHDLC